jgi:hypothetical protein
LQHIGARNPRDQQHNRTKGSRGPWRGRSLYYGLYGSIPCAIGYTILNKFLTQSGLEVVPAWSHKPNDGGSSPSSATNFNVRRITETGLIGKPPALGAGHHERSSRSSPTN